MKQASDVLLSGTAVQLLLDTLFGRGETCTERVVLLFNPPNSSRSPPSSDPFYSPLISAFNFAHSRNRYSTPVPLSFHQPQPQPPTLANTNTKHKMQFSTTTLLALLPTLTLAINANYVSPPPEHPTCKTTVYTCKGNLKCCTMDLQGTAMNIAAYCPPGGGNMPGTLFP